MTSDSGEREIVAALAKQLSLDHATVERIFMAGVDHAQRACKRQRISGKSVAEAGTVGGGEAAVPKEENSTTVHITKQTDCNADTSVAPIASFSFTQGVSFEQLRQELAEFALERDWDQFHSPRNLALAMVGEVGELCECFQWKGEVQEGLPGWTEKERVHLGQEMSDVLLYLLRLSHKCHVDLPNAALNKLSVNAAKYPAALVKGSSKKYNEYRAASRKTDNTK